MELAGNLKALERQEFTKSHVIVFSSLIHTPRPCDTTTQVILPQVPPVEGNINASLTSSKTVHSISMYWVSPHQMRVWGDFLEPTFNWALNKNIPMTLMDIERSKFSLQQGLKLEKNK